MPLECKACKASLEQIEHLRLLYLQENNCQIRYNAMHERGWSDSYMLSRNGVEVGYGSTYSQNIKGTRETIFEYYIVPHARQQEQALFKALLTMSGASIIEAQSNILLLSNMLHEFAENIYAPVVLFEDETVTQFTMPQVKFRQLQENEKIYTNDPGLYVLEYKNDVVANGGFLLHYNKPFADLFMDVKEEYRKLGFGSYLLQEIKKECYLAGRIPAARCNVNNPASRATLVKAGLKVVGHMLIGQVKTTP